jgi:hypothetical protein
MSKLAIAITMYSCGQILIWFQTNGQFKWKWFADNPHILAATGFLISYLFILGTKYAVEHFDGLLWPGRFLAFGLGIVSYALLTWWLMGEGINLKTLTSLLLATAIICVQLFWKTA